ncbi:Uncharacterised protein [Acinetobacter baumannii]|nr:Uncharacterised protein [Acinetobacter baumannii]
MVDVLKSAFGVDLENLKLEDGLDDANLKLKLTLTYNRKTSKSGQKVIDTVASSMRHNDDYVITLEDGTKVTADNLKMSGKISVETINNKVYNDGLKVQLYNWMTTNIILVTNMAKRYLPFYNNARFIALVLVGLFAIFSIIFKYLELNITINLVQFSFVLLLPLSQIYLAYKGMLDALKLDGLNQSERDRLTSTVDIRSKSSLYVAMLFIILVFSMYILNLLGLLSAKHLLALILSVGLTSIFSFFLAWSDLREISLLEKTLKDRKESREAKAKVLEQ